MASSSSASASASQDAVLLTDTSSIYGVAAHAMDPDGTSGQVYNLHISATQGLVRLASLDGADVPWVVPVEPQLQLLSERYPSATEWEATFEGTLPVINAALRTIEYVPHANANGAARLQFSLSEDGESGPTASVVVRIGAVNDAPAVLAPAEITLHFGQASIDLLDVRVVDVDVSESEQISAEGGLVSGVVTCQLSVSSGRLIILQHAGLSWRTAAGVFVSDMEFSGSVDAINSALSTLRYVCRASEQCGVGDHALTISVTDHGFSGVGTVLSTDTTVALHVV
jgi:hypothetical protein